MGNHAALWEVCRAFRRLNKNTMCATGLKKTRRGENKPPEKTKIKPPSALPASLLLLGTYLPKRASPSNHIYQSLNTFVCTRLEIIPAIMKSIKQNCDSLRTDKPFLGSQMEKPTLYTASKMANTQKEMKLYSILHRISSIWDCFGCCYHTQLPWYLRRFIKMITKDAQEMSSHVDRLFHLSLTNIPLRGQNATTYNIIFYLWQKG